MLKFFLERKVKFSLKRNKLKVFFSFFWRNIYFFAYLYDLGRLQIDFFLIEKIFLKADLSMILIG